VVGRIGQGEHIGATVTRENHALSIRKILATLAEEVPMVAILKTLGVMSSGVVLYLSLSTPTWAGMTHDPCVEKKGDGSDRVKCAAETREGLETVKGEVLRIEGDSLVVARSDGKKVNLHIDETTKMGSVIYRGDRIEAKVHEVNEQEHVVTIRLIE